MNGSCLPIPISGTPNTLADKEKTKEKTKDLLAEREAFQQAEEVKRRDGDGEVSAHARH
jgi:hypothetical protein